MGSTERASLKAVVQDLEYSGSYRTALLSEHVRAPSSGIFMRRPERSQEGSTRAFGTGA